MVAVISYHTQLHGTYAGIAGNVLDRRNLPYRVYHAYVTNVTERLMAEESAAEAMLSDFTVTPTELPRSVEQLRVRSRPGVDCVDADGNKLSGFPFCTESGFSRSAALGLPSTSDPIRPVVWHFAGNEKGDLFSSYEWLLPWRMFPAQDATFVAQLQRTVQRLLWAAPGTRMWGVVQSDVRAETSSPTPSPSPQQSVGPQPQATRITTTVPPRFTGPPPHLEATHSAYTTYGVVCQLVGFIPPYGSPEWKREVEVLQQIDAPKTQEGQN